MAKLKQDIANVNEEILYQQSGVKTLEMFDEKLRKDENNPEPHFNIGRVTELRNLEQSLNSKEQQRQKLIQDLIMLKKNFTFPSGSEESGSEKVCKVLDMDSYTISVFSYDHDSRPWPYCQ